MTRPTVHQLAEQTRFRNACATVLDQVPHTLVTSSAWMMAALAHALRIYADGTATGSIRDAILRTYNRDRT